MSNEAEQAERPVAWWHPELRDFALTTPDEPGWMALYAAPQPAPAPQAAGREAEDAARYRFIRDADKSDDLIPEIGLYAMESLDEYVDAAMAEYAAVHGIGAQQEPKA